MLGFIKAKKQKSDIDRLQVIDVQGVSNYNAANMLEKVSRSRIIQRLR